MTKTKYKNRKAVILTSQFNRRASHERPLNLENLTDNLLCKYAVDCKKNCSIQLAYNCQIYKFKEKYRNS